MPPGVGFIEATAHPHPQYTDFSQFPLTFDVGVLVLESPVFLPTYGELAIQQVDDAIAKQGHGDLNKLMYSGMVWEVGADGTRH